MNTRTGPAKNDQQWRAQLNLCACDPTADAGAPGELNCSLVVATPCVEQVYLWRTERPRQQAPQASKVLPADGRTRRMQRLSGAGRTSSCSSSANGAPLTQAPFNCAYCAHLKVRRTQQEKPMVAGARFFEAHYCTTGSLRGDDPGWPASRKP